MITRGASEAEIEMSAKSHGMTTLIEDGVFIGSDSTLVAPIVIGEGSYVAAGSCITEDVPADALAVGRARQTTKDGWARSRRATGRKEVEQSK